MTTKKKKSVSIDPQFVKDVKGKTTQVFLDIKTYDSIVDKLKKFAKIKKKVKSKKRSKK